MCCIRRYVFIFLFISGRARICSLHTALCKSSQVKFYFTMNQFTFTHGTNMIAVFSPICLWYVHKGKTIWSFSFRCAGAGGFCFSVRFSIHSNTGCAGMGFKWFRGKISPLQTPLAQPAKVETNETKTSCDSCVSNLNIATKQREQPQRKMNKWERKKHTHTQKQSTRRKKNYTTK